MSTFEAKVTSKGQITLPAAVRSGMRVEPGDRVVFSRSPDGSYRVDPKNRSLRDLRGIIRSGPRVTGADVEKWIEAARGRSMPAGLTRALERRTRGK